MILLQVIEQIKHTYPVWDNPFFYLFILLFGLSALAIVFILNAMKGKVDELKTVEQQHTAKINMIRKENEEKIDGIRIEMLKREDERTRQWIESEKETLHVLNGVSALLDLSEKIGRVESDKILKLLYAVEEKIEDTNNKLDTLSLNKI